MAENWTTTSWSTTATSQGTINLLAGWHSIEYQYFHVSGTNDIKAYVTVPSAAERAVALSDFAPVEQVLEFRSLSIVFSGAKTYKNDVLVYDGPDVPQLISPENGYRTELFRPELTVYQENWEYVEFQFDNSNLFGSSY